MTAPYITFVTNYMDALISFLNSTLGLWLNGILVTIVFAYIGGLSAKLDRSEFEFRRKFSLLLPNSMRKSSHRAYASVTPRNWYEESDLSLEDLSKIGGNVGPEGEVIVSKGSGRRAAKGAKKGRAVKAQSVADEDVQEVQPEEIPASKYPKKLLKERLVARAMRDYKPQKKKKSKAVRKRA
jgi:hypothetical protein